MSRLLWTALAVCLFFTACNTGKPKRKISKQVMTLRYVSHITEHIRHHLSNALLSELYQCSIVIKQKRGGHIEQILKKQCVASDKVWSLLQAEFRRLSPLPYRGYEAVFDGTLVIRL